MQIEGLEQRHLLSITLGTNAPDYAPGSTALLTAGGLTPGAEVQFQVYNQTTGALASGQNPWKVIDGGQGDLDGTANGSIQTNWFVDPSDEAGATLLATAKDLATGETATATFTDAPSPTISVGLDKSTDSGATGDNIANYNEPEFSGSFNHTGSSVVVSVDGGSPLTASVQGTKWNYTMLTPLSDGNHTVTASSGSGDTFVSDSFTITIDTVAPTIVGSMDKTPDGATGWYNIATGALDVQLHRLGRRLGTGRGLSRQRQLHVRRREQPDADLHRHGRGGQHGQRHLGRGQRRSDCPENQCNHQHPGRRDRLVQHRQRPGQDHLPCQGQFSRLGLGHHGDQSGNPGGRHGHLRGPRYGF